MTHSTEDFVKLNDTHQLHAIFTPKTVAVIGATEKEGSVGKAILWNLMSHPFGGTLYPINPKRANVLGIRAYTSILEVPEKIDLAVIATPAATVPGVMQACAKAGVRGAVIISAGFKEIGAEGAALEQKILEGARRSKIRIIGPNCLGVMNPVTGLNATFAAEMALRGNVGFISQSGALCTAILDWSLHEKVGFSLFVSIGSMLDVGWGDLIDYLVEDPNTKSILIYMETVGDARAFLSAAREAALSKPVIVIKAGRTQAAAKAASSHTGALAGSDDVLNAALRRSGVLRVNEISELFEVAEILSKQPRPRGPRLAIVTNAGGPGVLATDALVSAGGELASLAPETMAKLNEYLPPPWSHGNPIDILGDADPERYKKTIEIISKDPTADGILIILTPQAMTHPTDTARALKDMAQKFDKPILASWLGEDKVEAGRNIFRASGIPVFEYPDRAARMFQYMWQYTYTLRGLYETPVLPSQQNEPNRKAVTQIIDAAYERGRTLLTEMESKQVLEAYGIPVVKSEIAKTAEEAAAYAKAMCYPVVLKIHSESITHKTDVGGVHLNLEDETAVRHAFEAIQKSITENCGPEHFQGVSVQPMIKKTGDELILGSSIDPHFGPVLLFGAGGQLVELMDDRVLGLPPLNRTLARRMMEQTKIYRVLKGVRGRKPVNLTQLEDLLVRFSQLVSESRRIREIDINPLLASSEGLLALDARVILHDRNLPENEFPRLTIRPYPIEYVTRWQLRNGTAVTIRPIRPEDEPLMVLFHHTLSSESVHQRFFSIMKLEQRIAHERLIRKCSINYFRELALVADHRDEKTGEHRLIGVGRLTRYTGVNIAELAVTVSDAYQHQGLGKELTTLLIDAARKEKIEVVTAKVLPENTAMQQILTRLGFQSEHDSENHEVNAKLTL
ncbi:MAG: acetyl CoA synthetase subunit alpha [Candidatus Omnitrophica bacterium CG11_big_fil_rev_8_21_14_0_20_45_26]|uniref:Acetyl CoA synthetase subunit alpha n=1 Tax=Candidatus Abzuiibacterium crystallinum TaxID=1974748 RepID=A0A2H0LQP6_9BACT|nr:MAG: acetyl CoA synthetase subunit alpha [Candidatus Omnitrophica bacterium CG11_big_fil_rev_8_21_14_0_20_45_26]PIW64374.1 MAG: acetyl CoA synthetase subunit alpha [Candidatus Omnitrophica bacterium CG12_big_fil_rev_8_21_14_0_65_45_16]